MYGTDGNRLTSQVTSQRDYTQQEAHPDIVTTVPSPLTYPDNQVMWVCADCFMAYHTGDYSETDDALPFSEFDLSDGAIPIHQYVTSGMPTFWCACDQIDVDIDWDDHTENCETIDFSNRPCGACSTFLAGSRHAMTYDARYIR